MLMLVLKALFSFFILAFGLWGCLAIYFKINGLVGFFILTCWAVISLLALYATWFDKSGSGWIWAYLLSVALFIGIWVSLPARLDRDWADELAHTVTGTQDGRIVTLHNVRDFNWETGAQNWIDRRFDLGQLQGLDVILSYWNSPNIAHAIISFRFNDVEPIAFSVEIRKQKGQKFSSISGFFKTFEQAFIAANESDIVALRTNHRDPIEDVYLYPLTNPISEVEALFMGYVNRGNARAENPAWYHTITANCTTVIFDLVRSFRKDVKLDKRIILSGLLPDLFAERGVIDRAQPYGDYRAAAAITSKGQAATSRETFSTAIRK
jgi:hypothetical protein